MIILFLLSITIGLVYGGDSDLKLSPWKSEEYDSPILLERGQKVEIEYEYNESIEIY